jgi:hypothetical protein
MSKAVVGRSVLLVLALAACSEAHRVAPGGADAGGEEPDDQPAVIDAKGCRPDADLLVGGGRSFGLCRGECGFELALSSVIDLADGTCVGYRASLRVEDQAGQGIYEAGAELTEGAWDRAAMIASRLRGEQLEMVYGCPDCADGGAAWVQTQPRGDEARQHTYPFGAPAKPLAAADRFVQSLIDQLRSCQGADVVECSRSPLE